MHHLIARVVGKLHQDYKICSCSAINWYENEVCVTCGGTTFRDPHENEEEEILADFNYNDEAEIEV